MKFEFTYRNTAEDFFRFYMGNVYSQWTAVVNVVFTGALIGLTVSRWGSSGPLFRAVMVFGMLLFPVLQPLALYLRSVKSAEGIRPETTLRFDDSAMEIIVNEHRQRIPWKNFSAPVRRPGLVVIGPDGMHLYLLPDRVTGEQKEAVQAFLTEKCGDKK